MKHRRRNHPCRNTVRGTFTGIHTRRRAGRKSHVQGQVRSHCQGDRTIQRLRRRFEYRAFEWQTEPDRSRLNQRRPTRVSFRCGEGRTHSCQESRDAILWSGRPHSRHHIFWRRTPPSWWADQTQRVNAPFGGQATRYPVGFRPSGFEIQLKDGSLYPPHPLM